MQTWYAANLIAHVVAGAVGLSSMLVPLLSRKGGRVHRRAGWVFVVAMAVASLTGLGIAVAWLGFPLAARPPARALDPQQQVRYVEVLRTMGLFFGFISVLVGSSLWQGIVALRQRRGTIAWGNRVDRAFAATTAGLGAVLAVVGGLDTSPLLIGFGILGLVSGISDLRFYACATHARGTWLLRHIQAMLGGATAATTAFTVQFVGRTLGESGHGQWLLVTWAVPPIIGMLVTRLWCSRVRRSLTPGYTAS